MSPRKTIEIKVGLQPGQKRIYDDLKTPTTACFCGVGHGKTIFGARWMAYRFELNKRSSAVVPKAVVMAPYDRLLKRHHVPVVKYALYELSGYVEGKHYRYHGQDRLIDFSKSVAKYEIHFASAHNWQGLVAWEFDSGWWDEPGFANKELSIFFSQRVGRTRDIRVSQKLLTGVLQIANWYYEDFGPEADMEEEEIFKLGDWVNDIAPGYGGNIYPRYRVGKNKICYHASTFENGALSETYLREQYEAYGYNKGKFEAQIIGLAVPVNTDAVYDEFDEPSVVGSYKFDFMGENPFMHLCFDYNYGKMTLIVVQQYLGSHYAVWENSDKCKTTKDCCNEFKAAFPPERYGDRHLYIYGDQAGFAKSPQMKTRDGSISIIKNELTSYYESLSVKSKRYTIPQEIRVSSTNRFHAKSRLNPGGPGIYCDRGCKKLIKGWRLTEWDLKKGEIKKGKDDNHTHAPEAFDYYMYIAEPPIESDIIRTRGGYRR